MKEYIITNATIKQNSFGGYMVIADSERFGEQEILFESPFVEECEQYISNHTMNKTMSEEQLREVLKNLPEEKKVVLRKACERNFDLTSSYGLLQDGYVIVYAEGVYLMLTGTRTGFNVFVNRDGKTIRKPVEKKLHKIGVMEAMLSESVFRGI